MSPSTLLAVVEPGRRGRMISFADVELVASLDNRRARYPGTIPALAYGVSVAIAVGEDDHGAHFGDLHLVEI